MHDYEKSDPSDPSLMVQVTCTPGGQGDNAVIVLEKIVPSPTTLNPYANHISVDITHSKEDPKSL